MTSTKSLHMMKRREEMKRIERENLKIAQKIFAMKPSIRAVDQLKDFDTHRSISKGMRKITKQRIDAGVTLLPPIKGAGDANLHNDMTSEQRKFTLNSGLSLYQGQGPLTERKQTENTSTSEVSGLTRPMRPVGVEQKPKGGLGGINPPVMMNVVEEAKTAENFHDSRSPGLSPKAANGTTEENTMLPAIPSAESGEIRQSTKGKSVIALSSRKSGSTSRRRAATIGNGNQESAYGPIKVGRSGTVASGALSSKGHAEQRRSASKKSLGASQAQEENAYGLPAAAAS
jgi:hypothetical protein